MNSKGIKKINKLLINKKSFDDRSQCEMCKRWFHINDLDKDSGMLLCRECEDNMSMGVAI